MADELAVVENPMDAAEDEGPPKSQTAADQPRAVSEADLEAALSEFAAAGKMDPQAKLALYAFVKMMLDARLGPAEDLGATIKKAATDAVAFFSEVPTNWSVPVAFTLHNLPDFQAVQLSNCCDCKLPPALL